MGKTLASFARCGIRYEGATTLRVAWEELVRTTRNPVFETAEAFACGDRFANPTPQRTEGSATVKQLLVDSIVLVLAFLDGVTFHHGGSYLLPPHMVSNFEHAGQNTSQNGQDVVKIFRLQKCIVQGKNSGLLPLVSASTQQETEQYGIQPSSQGRDSHETPRSW